MSSPAEPGSAASKGDVPGYRGPEKPKLVVVGERFEPEDEPFTSKSGVSFCSVMSDAAIDPNKSGFCWATNGLMEQLAELRPAWVVLAGDRALQAIRPDLETRGMHGRPFSLIPMSERGPRDARLGGTVGFSTISHVALRRKPKLFHLVVLQELTALRRMARGTEGWLSSVPDTCCHCDREFHRIDDQGIVYCKLHWDWPTDPIEQLQRGFKSTGGDTAEGRPASP